MKGKVAPTKSTTKAYVSFCLSLSAVVSPALYRIFFRNLSICLSALVRVITKLQEVWPEVNYVFFTIVNAWNQLTHKITRWLTDLNCICTLFVNVTIMFILGSSVIIIQMAKTSILRPFLFWSIHLILSYPNRYFAMNKLYKAVAVL